MPGGKPVLGVAAMLRGHIGPFNLGGLAAWREETGPGWKIY